MTELQALQQPYPTLPAWVDLAPYLPPWMDARSPGSVSAQVDGNTITYNIAAMRTGTPDAPTSAGRRLILRNLPPELSPAENTMKYADVDGQGPVLQLDFLANGNVIVQASSPLALANLDTWFSVQLTTRRAA